MIPHDVWAEIDLKAISHNINQIKNILNPASRLMVVVKANAYGHGLLEIAGQAAADGVDALGVARLSEAIHIRESGIDTPILIFGYTPPALAEKLIDYDITQTLWSCQTARLLSENVQSVNKKIKVHLNIDTGMGRLGVLPGDIPSGDKTGHISKASLDEVESIKRLSGIDLEGIYTHFATADHADKTLALRQFEMFIDFVNHLKKRGIDFKFRHAANSAAIIDMPETHLEMVRAGISIYGHFPSDFVNKKKIVLKPAMTLKSKVIHFKKVNAGFKISYGATAETRRATTIATVPIGYGDGYSRLLSSKGKMIVCGHLAPVVGRICMDQTMLDVGDIPGVQLEDEVVVFGDQGSLSITVEEISNDINTISYEVLSNISHRIGRKYFR
ncbi:MAG: alanine racemase [Dissulfuribacterales bacterium]